MTNTTFTEAYNRLHPTLKQYIPVVDRVHGPHHPEFHDVRAIYEKIIAKIEANPAETPDLTEEFSKLRAISDNYAVPGDVCETYEAVYNMLSELDSAYMSQAATMIRKQ
ncbi:MAG: iron-sulfur cluster repair di-iron protein, ric [Smithella sp.]|nr:iron-sulfur cluster repair di-iron protein, ric [Smithella sp.]NLE83631.1 iron-sulfur cluster repair di-iron protein, ric [Chloroflexota bacterium]